MFLNRDDDVDEASRHRHWVAAVGVVLGCAIIVAAFPAMKREYATWRTIPGLTQTMAALRDQVQQVEKKAADTSAGQQSSLREEADGLAREMRGRIAAANKRAGESAQQMYAKVQEQIDAGLKSSAERLAGLSDRVATLESTNAAQQSQLSGLRREVGVLQDQTAEQAHELAKLHNEMADSSSDATQQIASLRRDQDNDHRDIQAFNDQVATERIPFEAAKNRIVPVAEGVSLRVSATDVRFRRVSGWIWLAGDARTIWLIHRSAQEPVIFYGFRDGIRHELVITNVTNDSITGYLVTPRHPARAVAAGDGE